MEFRETLVVYLGKVSGETAVYDIHALAFSFGFVTGYTAGAAIKPGFDLLTVD
ncbi:MAG: hypothetical protein GY722_19960 [bacterium]|nr:hypothetical protein [bacterium]